MFNRFYRSWDLVKASASVLSKDKELILFPLISSGALLLVALCFLLPAVGLGALDNLDRDELSAGHYLVAFLFYFSQYFVIFFFNAGLVGAALIRLEGGDPTFADGMRIAKSKVGAIAGYALIAATVGMILRAIQERVGFVGRIIVGLLGVGWSIATFLVVPVLVNRDVGPVEAVKESAALLKETWGENVIGRAGLGVAFGFIFVGVMILGLFIIFVSFMTHSVFMIGLAFFVTIVAVALTALVQTALGGIYAAALYRYATTGKETEGFDSKTLKLAFLPK
jgi:uncharacterized protein DUF6159